MQIECFIPRGGIAAIQAACSPTHAAFRMPYMGCPIFRKILKTSVKSILS